MAQLSKSAVTFRIGGDDLIPEEISKTLGVAPTTAQTKGEKIIGAKTGHVRTAKIGMWRLETANREPGDIDGQIQELLDQMTSDLDV